MGSTRSDDRTSNVDTRPRLLSRYAIERRDGDAGLLREPPEGLLLRFEEGSEFHDPGVSHERETVYPKMGKLVSFPRNGTLSPVGNEEKTIGEVIFAAIRQALEEDGQASVHRETGISTSTISRWDDPDVPPAFNSKTLEKVCKLDHVRADLAAHLLRRSESTPTAWQAIAGDLGELLTTREGRALVKKLRRMKELGIWDPDFALLDGAIAQKENAEAEKARAEKLATKKARSEKSA